jgi:hypothetical protein
MAAAVDWNFSWITPTLAVGGRFDNGEAERLACEHGIGAVVDLRAEDCDDRLVMGRCGLSFLSLPTEDAKAVSQSMLDEGVAFARRAESRGLRLLIHCEHGIGRSALLALCVLVDRGHEPMAALRLAKDAREKVSPSPEQHQGWVRWLERHGHHGAPAFEAFAAVAYRHLVQTTG